METLIKKHKTKRFVLALLAASTFSPGCNNGLEHEQVTAKSQCQSVLKKYTLSVKAIHLENQSI